MADLSARISCTPEVRDRYRALKEGGESYEELLRRLYAEHIEPDETIEESD